VAGARGRGVGGVTGGVTGVIPNTLETNVRLFSSLPLYEARFMSVTLWFTPFASTHSESQ